MVNQYQIYFANLDPSIGAEVKKTRPCVIVSPDEVNAFLKTVIIAPITSSIKAYPTRINISLKGKNGQKMIDHIRSIDKSRLLNRVGELNKEQIKKVKLIIKEMLVD